MNYVERNVDRRVQRRFFPSTRQGVFVDVGAARPDYLSVSAIFRERGWRIISIEPNPAFCELHRQRGYDVLEYACGERDEDGVPFFVVDSHGQEYATGQVSFESFSSLGIPPSYRSLKADLDQREIRVRMRRLDRILAEHASDVETIDILSIDVEGWELEVLNGLSVSRYKPKVMVIENLFDSRQYRTRLKELGYFLWKRLRPNDVYICAGCWRGLDRFTLPVYQRLIDRLYSK